VRRRPLSDNDGAVVRRFVQSLGEAYEIKTVLECPGEGADGDGGTNSLLLAAGGARVMVVVNGPIAAARVRASYAAAGAPPPEVVEAPGAGLGASLADVDLVVSFEGPPFPADWPTYFFDLARRARKLLVVIVRNPDRVGFARPHASLRQTSRLAPFLWQLGRVRDHVYLGVPWPVAGALTVFGGGASAEVHREPVSVVVRRTALLHAFVVDTAPRTRQQAKKRLRTLAGTPGPAG